jgi:hypothetical protein
MRNGPPGTQLSKEAREQQGSMAPLFLFFTLAFDFGLFLLTYRPDFATRSKNKSFSQIHG